MPYRDYYRILQVHPDAGPEVIQAAYRRLARTHHPDAGAVDDAAMQALNEAYAVLSDPVQRAAFDRGYRSQVLTGRQPLSSDDPGSNADSDTSSQAPLWRALIPVALSLLVLSVLVLDVWRLGVRGFPEITLILVAVGWLLYHFGGLRDRWR